MKSLALSFAGLFAFGLAACGGGEEPASPMTSEAEMPTEMPSPGAMTPDDHDMDSSMSGIGHATGTIRSVEDEGGFLTIDHGPISGGIEMGAMTMGFDIMGEVDLSGFAEGDEVAFMVKQGRDGSYRIMAICNTVADGADCLNGMMDH